MRIRPYQAHLSQRLNESEPLIQVLLGPRQVGKTTAVVDLQKSMGASKFFYVSADEALAHSSEWIREKWSEARRMGDGVILAIDEIQKVIQWSEAVKQLWDEQRRTRKPDARLKLVLLGSSSLELQKGLNESLAGRFEVLRAYHWDAWESQQEFNIDFDRFLSYGGYPGSYRFIDDFNRWHAFMRESIIETVIGKDLLSLRSVHKPALFRQTFELLCRYPAQEISYTKLLGQLQEKGNVEIVKHYLSLYEGAFLFKALEKYSTSSMRKKASSPKILPLCPAFYAMTVGENASNNPEDRGRLFEVAVGSVLNQLPGDLFYWRDGNHEVDFVHCLGKRVIGIEVKSGRAKKTQGMEAFRKRFRTAKTVIIRESDIFEFTRDASAFLAKYSM